MLDPKHKAYYANTLSEEIAHSVACNRLPKGAWLKQRILRRDPQFSEHRLGFSSFRDFVNFLGFTVEHDGSDIVVSEGSPSSAPPAALVRLATPALPPPRASRRDRVDHSLWRAFTRDPTGVRAYLDKEALARGQLAVAYDDPIGETSDYAEDDRYVLIPANSPTEQTEWFCDWAREALGPPDAERLPALARAEGFQPASRHLSKESLRSWFSFRASKTVRALRQWVEDCGFPWQAPFVRSSIPREGWSQGPTAGSTIGLRALALEVVARLPEESLRALCVPLGLVYDIFDAK